MEIHCLEHSLTRMLAGGLVLEIASAFFSVHRIESYRTGLSGSPGYHTFLTGFINPVLSPSVGVVQLS